MPHARGRWPSSPSRSLATWSQSSSRWAPCRALFSGSSMRAGAEPSRGLVQWDAWGNRIDAIELTPVWDGAARVAAERGVVASAYERRHGDHSRIRHRWLARLPPSRSSGPPMASRTSRLRGDGSHLRDRRTTVAFWRCTNSTAASAPTTQRRRCAACSWVTVNRSRHGGLPRTIGTRTASWFAIVWTRTDTGRAVVAIECVCPTQIDIRK